MALGLGTDLYRLPKDGAEICLQCRFVVEIHAASFRMAVDTLPWNLWRLHVNEVLL